MARVHFEPHYRGGQGSEAGVLALRVPLRNHLTSQLLQKFNHAVGYPRNYLGDLAQTRQQLPQTSPSRRESIGLLPRLISVPIYEP